MPPPSKRNSNQSAAKKKKKRKSNKEVFTDAALSHWVEVASIYYRNVQIIAKTKKKKKCIEPSKAETSIGDTQPEKKKAGCHLENAADTSFSWTTRLVH